MTLPRGAQKGGGREIAKGAEKHLQNRPRRCIIETENQHEEENSI